MGISKSAEGEELPGEGVWEDLSYGSYTGVQ